MNALLKTILHALTITGSALFLTVLTLLAALYGTGVLTKAKMTDVARVVDGKLQSPPEVPAAPAPEPKKASEIASAKELQTAVEEWQKEQKAERDALAAQKDAIEAMQRELENRRVEQDAREQDLRKRIAAYDQQKAAELAAAGDAKFLEAVKTYSKMDAKDTAKDLFGLADDVVVRYLHAFKDDFRAEVLTEVQKLDDKSRPVSAPGTPNRAAKLIQILSGSPAEVAATTVTGTAQK